MGSDTLDLRVEDWVEKQVSLGKEAFSLETLEKSLPQQSQTAIKRSLNRLSRKEKIVSVHKGYYVIVTPQYASQKILPPALFIDGLMRYLKRPYYVGLLNAAAFYGAAHQAPQEYFVFTNFPAMRPTRKKGIKINYISKRQIPENLLENRKTPSGYLKTSSPELTASDLVQYQKRIGGLNRAVTVLAELIDAISIERINAEFLPATPTAVIQRLGYLLEDVLRAFNLSEHLYQCALDCHLDFFPIPLNSAGRKRGFPFNKKWDVIINQEIDSDW